MEYPFASFKPDICKKEDITYTQTYKLAKGKLPELTKEQKEEKYIKEVTDENTKVKSW